MFEKVKNLTNNQKFKSLSAKIKDIFINCRDLCKKLYHWFYQGIDKSGQSLHKIGVSANVVSVMGFVIGLSAINFLAMGMFGYALFCILLNRFFDALDGAIAKYAGVSAFGVFLDAALDYIFYAGVILGFALANPAQNAVPAAFLMFGFMAAAATLLSYGVIAYRYNAPQQAEVKQSPFYLGGFAQGAEVIVAFIILCLVPGWFLPIAIILGCLSFVKALSVIATAYYNFVIAPRKISKK